MEGSGGVSSERLQPRRSTRLKKEKVNGPALTSSFEQTAIPVTPETEEETSLRQSHRSGGSGATQTIRRRAVKRKVEFSSANKEAKSCRGHGICTESRSDDPSLLLDLGNLVKGTVLKRPSAKVKSPYVADVQVYGTTKDEDKALAHAPALGVGGLCSPGATVLMRARPPGGKTTHSIDLVSATGPDGKADTVLIGAHPSLGEKLAEIVLQRGLLEEALGIGPVGNDIVLKRQVTHGDSRVDFELIDNASRVGNEPKRLPIEVKNVVCADFSSKHAPKKSGPNHCVVISESEDNISQPYQRTGLFPWGGNSKQTFEGERVVSERAIKHIRNLVDLGRSKNVQPAILFVVNRDDCDSVRPCHEACPKFAVELKAAAENGVRVIAFRVRWQNDGKAFFDGVLPVQL